jgi:hypothetical protein
MLPSSSTPPAGDAALLLHPTHRRPCSSPPPPTRWIRCSSFKANRWRPDLVLLLQGKLAASASGAAPVLAPPRRQARDATRCPRDAARCPRRSAEHAYSSQSLLVHHHPCLPPPMLCQGPAMLAAQGGIEKEEVRRPRCCHARMPTTCSTKSLKGVNLPVDRRGDSIQTKPDNQTHRFLARLSQHRQPNMCCLH